MQGRASEATGFRLPASGKSNGNRKSPAGPNPLRASNLPRIRLKKLLKLRDCVSEKLLAASYWLLDNT
jgi:hypothetical protein